jgi:hypothetical protein
MYNVQEYMVLFIITLFTLYHTVATVPRSNSKIVERQNEYT